VGTDADLIAAINQGMKLVPCNSALGLYAVAVDPKGVTIALPYRQELVGNPETGVIHGGAITALLDATSGVAVFLRMANPTRIATLDLRIDYLKPATPPKEVRARAECYKLTRQVAFVHATAFHEDPHDAIASAAGTFVIFEDRPSPMGRMLKNP